MVKSVETVCLNSCREVSHTQDTEADRMHLNTKNRQAVAAK